MCFRGGRFWGRENLVPAEAAEDFKNMTYLQVRNVCSAPAAFVFYPLPGVY